MRRIAFAALLATILGVAAYAAASAFVWDRLTTVAGDCPPAFAGNDPTAFVGPPPGDFGTAPYRMPEPEEVLLPSREAGIAVSGWWLPAEAADAPAVVVVHGHGSCKRDHAVLLPAGMLHRNGFSVLLIDLRDHGDSSLEDGRYAGGTEEYREVLGAWDWLLEEQGLPAGRIGLLGISLGAATALIATGEEPRVAAVWEDSSYADIRVAIRAELRRNGYPELLEWGGVSMAALLSGDDLANRSPLAAAHKLEGRPLYVTHGDADARLSVDYARELVAAVEDDGGSVASWIVPGAGHTHAMLNHPDEYEDRLVGFFRSALGGSR